MSKTKKERKLRQVEYNRRVSELDSIRSQLQNAYCTFNNTTDSSMLDACIFEISALNARYSHAVKSIKELE